MKKLSFLLLTSLLAASPLALAEGEPRPTADLGELEQIGEGASVEGTPTDEVFRNIRTNNPKKVTDAILDDADLGAKRDGKTPFYQATENMCERAKNSRVKSAASHLGKATAGAIGAFSATALVNNDNGAAALAVIVAAAVGIGGFFWWDYKRNKARDNATAIANRICNEKTAAQRYEPATDGTRPEDLLNTTRAFWTRILITSAYQRRINQLRDRLRSGT